MHVMSSGQSVLDPHLIPDEVGGVLVGRWGDCGDGSGLERSDSEPRNLDKICNLTQKMTI